MARVCYSTSHKEPVYALRNGHGRVDFAPRDDTSNANRFTAPCISVPLVERVLRFTNGGGEGWGRTCQVLG